MKRLKGLYQDTSPVDQPDQTYREALNANINLDLGSISTEEGNKRLTNSGLSANFIPIASTSVYDNRIIIFSADLSGNSEIGVLENDSYTKLFDDGDITTGTLNFTFSNQIKSTVKINNESEAVIYWTDGLNPPRYLNIDDVPTISDVNDLNMFNSFSSPLKAELLETKEFGGKLISGTYQFAFAYKDSDGNRSNYISITNPISIHNNGQFSNNTQGSEPETPTSKSIELTLSNIDTSYSELVISVLHYSSGTLVSALTLPEKTISGSTFTLLYTGGETTSEASQDDIFIDRASYESAKELAQQDGVLYLGNLTKKTDIGYQKYANNIEITRVDEELGDLDVVPTGKVDEFGFSFNVSERQYYEKGYQRDQVYAFYIAFILKDGSQSYAYHIPGRESEGDELTDLDDGSSDPNEVLFKGGENSTPSEASTTLSLSGASVTTGFTLEVVELSTSSYDATVAIVNGDTEADIGNKIETLVNVTESANFNFTVTNDGAGNLTFTEDTYDTVIQVTLREFGSSGLAGTELSSSNNPANLTGGSASIDGIDSDAKQFHYRSLNGSRGFGYWENGQEVYPNTDDFDVYDVNGSGVGIVHATKSSLKTEKVRHHRFPENQQIPFVDTSDTIINFGIKVNNIKIPTSILNQVIGFKIYYADRTNNSLVLGTSLMIPQKLESVGSVAYNTNDVPLDSETGTINTSVFAMHPFNLMRTQKSLGEATYLKNYSEGGATGQVISQPVGSSTTNGGGATFSPISLLDFDDSDRLRIIKAKGYVPSNVDAVSMQSLNFDNDKKSSKEESQILLDISSNLSRAYDTDDSGDMDYSWISSIHSHKIELYNSFDQQELVWTGFIETDVAKYDPSNASYGAGTQSTGSITIESDATATGTLTFTISGLRYSSILTFDVTNGDTKLEIATALSNYLNTNSDYYSSTVDSGGSDPIINITAMQSGTNYDGTITETANLGSPISNSIVSMTGGVDTTTSTAEFFGGDTYIGYHAFRISQSTDEKKLVVRLLVEDVDNISNRSEGSDFGQLSPNLVSNWADILDLEDDDSEDNADVWYDNYIGYDESYSRQGILKSAIPLPKNLTEISNFPTRVIKSQEDASLSTLDNFRIFLDADFLDLPRNRGEITNLAVLNNTLLVHMRRGLFRTRGREELVTGDFRAFIGDGNIFEVKPNEIYNTSNGFGGLQDSTIALESEAGYFFTDMEAGTIFLYSDELEELSEKGMRNFFSNNLKWFIDDTNQNHTNIPFVSFISAYDPKYNRIIVTKVDYEPTALFLSEEISGDIVFSESKKKWETSPGATTIEFTDTDYFIDKSFTISYLPEIKAWVSFHDYKPNFYCSNIYKLLSFYPTNGDFYEHDWQEYDASIDYCKYYGTQNSFRFQFSDNPSSDISKSLINFEYEIRPILQSNGSFDWDKNLDRFRIRNDIQDSGIQNIIYFTSTNGNARLIDGTWRINKFRDFIDPSTNTIDTGLLWHEQKRFIGKYVLIDLYYDTPEHVKLNLISSKANFKESNR